MGWLVAVGLALLAPALAGGTKLGPYDLLRYFGVGAVPGPLAHNVIDSDQIQQFIPWTTQAWTQVHHGHLPLWNPDTLTGMPLAFNFQSAVFSLPSAVGYLVPVRFAFDLALVVKLVVAGTGAFALCRVLRTGVLAAAFCGTVYELSGAFSGWLGWPQSGVLAFTGWILAAAVLVVRSKRRLAPIAGLAVALALAVYGGHPESAGISYLVLLVFGMVLVLADPERRKVAAILRLGLGALGGLGLSAPLWLAGGQVLAGSARIDGGGYGALPVQDAILFAFQGYDGTPVLGGHFFGTSNYYDTAAYVGVAVIALALVALVTSWRRPEVLALAVLGVVAGAVVYLSPLSRIIDHIPLARGVLWYRLLMPLDLIFAVLGALGLQRILDRPADRATRRAVLGSFGLAGVSLAGLFLWFLAHRASLASGAAHDRLWSFAWPGAEVAVGLAGAAWLWWPRAPRASGAPRVARPADTSSIDEADRGTAARARRRAVGVGIALLAVETGFLLWAGAPLWSSASQSFAVTPGEAQLARVVGSARVGFGSCPSINLVPSLGILPDANVAYGINEFAVDDPVLPSDYYRSWGQALGRPQPVLATGKFCGAISTVALARRYGIRYVLELPGAPGPTGTTEVATVSGEGLYRVPGVSLATVATSSGSTPATSRALGPDAWRIAVSSDRAGVLQIRLTDVPGWQASIDGRPLTLHRWDDVMLQGTVPAGTHVVVLRYQPRAFDVGLVLAAATVALLVACAVFTRLRPARRDEAAPQPQAPWR